MKQLTHTTFRSMTGAELKAVLPVTILFEGEPLGIICNPADVIFIGDMHPRVRIQMKAKEALVRRGMKPDEKFIPKEVAPMYDKNA